MGVSRQAATLGSGFDPLKQSDKLIELQRGLRAVDKAVDKARSLLKQERATLAELIKVRSSLETASSDCQNWLGCARLASQSQIEADLTLSLLEISGMRTTTESRISTSILKQASPAIQKSLFNVSRYICRSLICDTATANFSVLPDVKGKIYPVLTIAAKNPQIATGGRAIEYHIWIGFDGALASGFTSSPPREKDAWSKPGKGKLSPAALLRILRDDGLVVKA